MAPKSRSSAQQSSFQSSTASSSSTTVRSSSYTTSSSATKTSSSDSYSSSTPKNPVITTTNPDKPIQTPAASSRPVTSTKGNKNPQDAQEIVQRIWSNYLEQTPQRVKLLDVFMAFLIVVGGLQFVYCIIVGNFPFNAFLAGFSATVGQFVLTASLRIQTNPVNAAEFKGTSHERAFADFIFGSLILHFFCVNFIN